MDSVEKSGSPPEKPKKVKNAQVEQKENKGVENTGSPSGETVNGESNTTGDSVEKSGSPPEKPKKMRMLK